MKILEKGKESWLKEYFFKCNRCGCEFIATEEELKNIRAFTFILNELLCSMKCPTCGASCSGIEMNRN